MRTSASGRSTNESGSRRGAGVSLQGVTTARATSTPLARTAVEDVLEGRQPGY
ncbi:hypothetical protein [Paludisphaera soli]|uniref:hypothetical protein n=1 Tax=Paludisphaera soli TaxID=2712865 RepID=UPI0013EC27AF|nr:hypothetical protein [Paludisphaera soli]